MAVQTKVLGLMVDDISGETARVEADWDDVALRLLAVRVLNPTSRALIVLARKIANGRTYERTFPAGTTEEQAIPANPPAARIDLTVDERGRLVGFEIETRWVV